MADIYGLVVYDSVLFRRTGQISNWAHSVERKYTANAIKRAPVNRRQNKGAGALPVGSLKASIFGNVSEYPALKVIETEIYVNVPYAAAVINGTENYIRPNNRFLKLPINPGFGTRVKHTKVSGQDGNDFLERAHFDTSRTHSSLRGGLSRVFQSSF